jgi:hypothetical protein
MGDGERLKAGDYRLKTEGGRIAGSREQGAGRIEKEDEGGRGYGTSPQEDATGAAPIADILASPTRPNQSFPRGAQLVLNPGAPGCNARRAEFKRQWCGYPRGCG